MCSGSEAGSYLRLIDFVYHSTLGLRVIKKKKGATNSLASPLHSAHPPQDETYRGTSLIRKRPPPPRITIGP